MEYILSYIRQDLVFFESDFSRLPSELRIYYVSTDWHRLTFLEKRVVNPWVEAGILCSIPDIEIDSHAVCGYKINYGDGISWETYASIEYCRMGQRTLITDNMLAQRICVKKSIRVVTVGEFRKRIFLNEFEDERRVKIKKSGRQAP
jgi:hypothetical protein